MTERRARRRQRGFALVLALWAGAIVLAIAAAFDAWVGSRVEQARLVRVRVQDGLDAYSTRATLLYLLGTQRFTRAGLTTGEPPPGADAPGTGMDAGELRIDPVGNEVGTDGRAYAGLGRVRFALQDQAGTIPLNTEGADSLADLLGAFEADETVVQGLLDTLADYRDANTLRRLNGAEREEYLAAGLPPPPDRDLRAVPELLQVQGWREWIAAHPGFRTHEWLSTGRIEDFNPNAVPEALLARLPGQDADRAARIVAERLREPFRSVPDFQARADLELARDEEGYRFFPSDALQLRLWAEGSAFTQVLAIHLTPLGRQGPWQVDGIYHVGRTVQDPSIDEVPGELFGTGAPAAR